MSLLGSKTRILQPVA